ncbi:MAG: molybdopterin-dependent oxidoreductase [Polyangiaceae bacterium]|nr:molybdopterin-dependent oxidoreductase [Polyangiaceae bacterium]
MPGLGTTLGRGGATTAPQDLLRADCILIQGSSMAEAHPVAFRWVVAAKERGATVIHVDPRFSRTSALADLWIPLRAGTDIVLLGGLIRHVLEHELYFREYVLAFTNASVLVGEHFRDTEDLAGLFSGYDPEQGAYDGASWRFAGDDPARPERDETLTDPRCVLQLLRRHFQRYTPELVRDVCGVPPELFAQLARALTDASGPDKTAALCYAVGWTQHSKGVQIIRAGAILQLLLGNVGRPGGGILALRGHASIQGSTDIPTLYDLLPGYLPMPKAGVHTSLDQYLGAVRSRGGGWHDADGYVVSLLKAYYGGRARADNDWGFDFLPRITRDHSHFGYFMEMMDGKVEGLFVMGQNPAVGGQHARFERTALSRLKWLVVRDLVEVETASFWYDSPEVRRGELHTTEIGTEVFLMPAAGHAEKAGTFTNTQRLLQFRDKAVEPPGDAKSELWFVHQLARRLKEMADVSARSEDEPLRALDWWYPENEHGEPEVHAVLAEINGYHTEPDDGAHHGPQVAGFADLRADGSTACGCWIYSGVLGPDGVNRARQRAPEGAYFHGWGYAWPADRRILYNRASARPDGAPWSEAKKLVWWDHERRRWTGLDVPDFVADKAPDYRPPPGAVGLAALRGDAPFVMQADGLSQLFVAKGLADGPLPSHYEAIESPVDNSVYEQQKNPVARLHVRPDNPLAEPGDPRFPIVLTTYRLTEHHTAGGMSRFLTHLAELMPELFVELSPELATSLGIEHGGVATVVTPRGAVQARALVTARMRPLFVAGRWVHQVAMPFHWGGRGHVTGDVTNDLIPLLGEPNVGIHEAKALCCALFPGPRPPDASIPRYLAAMAVRPTPERV